LFPRLREMSYSYDRQKTAAKLDVHSKWRDVVDKHAEAEQKDFEALLKDTAKYLKSEGLDLDLKRSWLGKRYSGSDGVRRTGELYVSERPENTIEANERSIVRWVEAATDMHGSARKVGEGPAKRQVDDKPVGVWVVDVGEY
jgi:hypothetical protein